VSYFYLFCAVFFLSPSLLLAQDKTLPEKALCIVCALKSGENELEKVRAHSEHEGETYYFCSEGCKEEFDADPAGYAAPQFPRPAPAIVVETLAGEDMALEDYRGQWVLLDFWATWCKPCVEMMPQLQKLSANHADKGLVVLGVAIDEDKNRIKKIERFVDKVGVSYPIFSDAKENPAWHMFKVKVLPTLFLIDREGQIVAQWIGKVDHKKVASEVASRMMAPVDREESE